MKYVANIYFLFSGFFTATTFFEIALEGSFNIRQVSIEAAIFAVVFFLFQQWWKAHHGKKHPDVPAREA